MLGLNIFLCKLFFNVLIWVSKSWIYSGNRARFHPMFTRHCGLFHDVNCPQKTIYYYTFSVWSGISRIFFSKELLVTYQRKYFYFQRTAERESVMLFLIWFYSGIFISAYHWANCTLTWWMAYGLLRDPAQSAYVPQWFF